MTKKDKINLRLASLRFQTAPFVEKIVDALRNRRTMNENELGQYGIEIAQAWVNTDAPHDWTKYNPKDKKQRGKTFYNDGGCLSHIIKKVAMDVYYIMRSELKPILKRIGVIPCGHGAKSDLWLVLDCASYGWLRAYQKKMCQEKNEKAGVAVHPHSKYPIEAFNIPDLANRLLDEAFFTQSQNLYEQLSPVADTMAEIIDNLDPEMKYALSGSKTTIERSIHFMLSADSIFDTLENELCIMFSESRLARAMSHTPDDICSALRILVQDKIAGMAE